MRLPLTSPARPVRSQTATRDLRATSSKSVLAHRSPTPSAHGPRAPRTHPAPLRPNRAHSLIHPKPHIAFDRARPSPRSHTASSPLAHGFLLAHTRPPPQAKLARKRSACVKIPEFWPRNRVLARARAISSHFACLRFRRPGTLLVATPLATRARPESVPERGLVARNQRISCTKEQPSEGPAQRNLRFASTAPRQSAKGKRLPTLSMLS